MSAAIALRKDFNAEDLRRLAKASHDAGQGRRLLALAMIYGGATRTEAARVGAVGPQTVRDWVVAFNLHGPDGLIGAKAPGRTPKLSPEQRQVLAAIIKLGPDPEGNGVLHWRLKDLVGCVHARFGVRLDESTLGRLVRTLGLRKLSARPRLSVQTHNQ